MAMKMIDQAHLQKGRIRSFVSYCGGLPSPAAANNPLAYKFRYLLFQCFLLVPDKRQHEHHCSNCDTVAAGILLEPYEPGATLLLSKKMMKSCILMVIRQRCLILPFQVSDLIDGVDVQGTNSMIPPRKFAYRNFLHSLWSASRIVTL